MAATEGSGALPAAGRAWRRLAFCLWALLAGAAPARAGALYPIDQRFGSIGFSVGDLGLFSSQGSFGRFRGTLFLDLAHPDATRIVVTIDAGSIMMGWSAAAKTLRSPAYFDVTRYPLVHFASRRVIALAPGRYRIEGTIEIRGIRRPQLLKARLVHLGPGPRPGTRMADFVVTGELRRSGFGMRADRLLIANVVHLVIHAHILLQGGADG